ncbi:MAG: patatin-like phospholipase family protein, partial [Bdellovibrio bacteriovorus]
ALLLLTLLILIGLAPTVLPVTASAGERPKIGLALGGGGARGAAHVGVLRTLEELGVPVDYVAGTSMGSIVGGLYAMGMSPDDIERTIEEIDWTDIFRDGPPRQDRRFRRKQDDRTFLIDARPGVIEKERKVELVPALIQGQKLELALRKYSLPATEVHDFDDLRIPFRAVATDVVTGEAVILGEGDLATAMRASMAVPAVFAPVEIGDRLLVDGGLAMNLPVSAVRAMGADIVIAVDVGGPRRQREEIGNVLAMLDQIASLVTFRNTEEEIAKLGPRDLLIVPPLEREVLASDFPKMPTAVAIGQRAAQAKRPELARLSLPPAQYAAYQADHSPPPYQPPTIDYIRIENDSRLRDDVIASRIQVRPGDRLDPAALEHQLARVFDQDNFQSVRYRVEKRDGETGVVIDANKKAWGTSSLQGGLELSSTGAGDSMFNIGVAYTMAPLNGLNGEWRTILRAGEEPGIVTEVYQPLDPAERWYLQGGLAYLSENLRVLGPRSRDVPIAEYQITRAGGFLEGGRNIGNWGRLGLRYTLFSGDVDLEIGEPEVADYQFDVGQLQARLTIDSLDSLNFPRSGWAGQIYGITAREWLGSSDDYELIGFDLLKAGTWGKDSLLGALSIGSNLGGEIPIQAYYRLGGFLNLSGFNQWELSGPYAGLARAIYLRDLGTGLVRTYAGASLEAGNTWQDQGDIRLDQTRVAGALFLGADTILGPVYLGYGHADGGNNAVYLYLGRPWLLGLRGF